MLSLGQFAVHIGVEQVSPGLFLIKAAFVGYNLGSDAAAESFTSDMLAQSIAISLIVIDVFGLVHDLKAVKARSPASRLHSFVCWP